MKLQPALAALEYFVSDWSLSLAPVEDEAVGALKHADWSIRPDLDGFWLYSQAVQHAEPNTWTFQNRDYWGYDPAEKCFLRFFITNSFGGEALIMRSPGWDGDTFIWSSFTNWPPAPPEERGVPRPTPIRQVLRRVTHERMDDIWQVSFDGGNRWTRTMDGFAVRRPGAAEPGAGSR